jgi:hypothetical protein
MNNSVRTGLIASACGVALTASAAVAGVQTHVVPDAFANTPGGAAFIGPLANSERTYQQLIHESLLTDLVGRQITAVTFRLGPNISNPWPADTATYSFYNIFLSGSVAPADRSLTFSENIVGPQTQVRSGSLMFDADSFPVGNSPNDFGAPIGFDSGWLYTGGHLLLEIRHSGSDSTSRSVEALSASSSPGYGNLYSAAWQGNADAETGFQGNFAIPQFTTIAPAPGALALLGLAGLCGTRRRRN